jgi:hypothetical protein
MEFSWATSTEEDYKRMNIFHNAGVTNATEGRFYKAQYMDKLPYNEKLEIKEGTASWHYWRWVQLTAKNTVLI